MGLVIKSKPELYFCRDGKGWLKIGKVIISFNVCCECLKNVPMAMVKVKMHLNQVEAANSVELSLQLRGLLSLRKNPTNSRAARIIIAELFNLQNYNRMPGFYKILNSNNGGLKKKSSLFRSTIL